MDIKELEKLNWKEPAEQTENHVRFKPPYVYDKKGFSFNESFYHMEKGFPAERSFFEPMHMGSDPIIRATFETGINIDEEDEEEFDVIGVNFLLTEEAAKIVSECSCEAKFKGTCYYSENFCFQNNDLIIENAKNEPSAAIDYEITFKRDMKQKVLKKYDVEVKVSFKYNADNPFMSDDETEFVLSYHYPDRSVIPVFP